MPEQIACVNSSGGSSKHKTRYNNLDCREIYIRDCSESNCLCPSKPQRMGSSRPTALQTATGVKSLPTVVVTSQRDRDTIHKQCRRDQTAQTWHRRSVKLHCCTEDCVGKSDVCKRLVDDKRPMGLVLSGTVVDA